MSIKSNTKRFLGSLLVCMMTLGVILPSFTANVVNAEETKTYELTVKGGIIKNGEEVGRYKEGEKVTVVPDDDDSLKCFYEWKFTGLEENRELFDRQMPGKEYTFTMPARSVTAEAIFEEAYYYIIEATNGKFTTSYDDVVNTDVTFDRCPAERTKVKLTADPDTDLEEFAKWEIKGLEEGSYDDTQREIEFNMPTCKVEAKAIFKDKLYPVEVPNGTVKGDKTEFKLGEKVTIKADSEDGRKKFIKWQIYGLEDGTSYDETKEEITFTMPARKVIAQATYKLKSYKVNLKNAVLCDGRKEFQPGTRVTVMPLEGKYAFDKWSVTELPDGSYDETKRELTFTMPESDVNVEAILKARTYKVTVKNGEIDGNKTEFVAGEEVTVKANSDEKEKTFYQWVISDEKRTATYDTGKREITFTMPARDVTAEAMFKNVDYTFIIVNGNANVTYGDIVDKETTGGWYPASETTVSIEADPDTDTKEFDRWEIKGLKEGTYDAKERKLEFTMPAKAVRAEAIYKDKTYKVFVKGGTIKGKGKTGEFKPGEQVTIVPEVNKDKQKDNFAYWKICNAIYDESFNCKFEYDYPEEFEYTFTMPEHGITATAYFSYGVTVTDGQAWNLSDSKENYSQKLDNCLQNEKVKLKANPDTDTQVFDRWEIEGLKEGTYNAKERKLEFTMPANNVKVKAIYKDRTYIVTLWSFSFCRILDNSGENYKHSYKKIVPGEKVTVVVDNDNMVYYNLIDGWNINGIPVENLEYVVDVSKEKITFIMPAYNIVVKALSPII